MLIRQVSIVTDLTSFSWMGSCRIYGLIQRCSGGIREGNQFAQRIFFRGERNLRLGVDNRQLSAGVDPAQKQAVALDAHDSILLVEN
jgi:hypothetical protein